MGRRNKGRNKRKKGGRKSNRPSRRDRQAAMKAEEELAMNQLHALFIKMNEEFKGCTLSGVAIDASTGAICIHVEEHNKVMMFHDCRDFSIAEHAGKLRDMLLAAGFLVPEPVMETWNQEFTDMATEYAKAVMAEREIDPEVVDAARIKLILGPFYSPEEAHAELAKLTGRNKDQVAKDAENGSEAAPGEVEALKAQGPVPSLGENPPAVKTYLSLSSELAEMPEGHADRPALEAEVAKAWESLSDAEKESLKPKPPAEVEA